MKQKLMTVSVGIPALNEEANIKNLILAILDQNISNFVLERIIVVSDGSTDNTVSEVKSVSDKRIILLKNRIRIGKALSQNKIVKQNKSDILVIFDADVLPKGRNFLKNIISPIEKNVQVGIVGAKVDPIGADTFIGKVIDFSAEVKHRLYAQKNGGHNIYNCHGRARAFSLNFLGSFQWRATFSEDAFSYFSCLSKGYEFVYQPKAVVLYKSPQTIRDHIKQSVRFFKGQSLMEKYFGTGFVRREYSFSPSEFITEVTLFIYKNPVLFLSYLGLYFLAVIKSKFKSGADAKWEVSQSSKVVASSGQ